MKHISVLKNVIQEYAWGSHTALSDLLGYESPSRQPQAELWLGAHEKAPSIVCLKSGQVPLNVLIEKDPEAILGKEVARRFSNQLPYLFKILAAEKPLSIQAHPNQEQAREGFDRENRLGIALDAKNRNYKDPNHKPECICALTPFWALCGFRKIPEMLSLLSKVAPEGLSGTIRDLSNQPNAAGLKAFFKTFLTLAEDRQKCLIQDAVARARSLAAGNAVHDPVYEWMLKLHAAYGDDMGLFSPILLNLVCLEPGQALFLEAGELHAYLDGVGIELMANSDNVLRGGLTPKHVDVPELLKVLNFKERAIEILSPIKTSDCEQIYPSTAAEFVLSRICVRKGRPYVSQEKRGVEIVICTQGDTVLSETGGIHSISLFKGQSAVIPAAAAAYRIEGEGILYKAAVPVYKPGTDL